MIKTFLVAEEKFILDMRLRKSGVTCVVSGPFTKNKKRKEIKESWDSRYIYQNE